MQLVTWSNYTKSSLRRGRPYECRQLSLDALAELVLKADGRDPWEAEYQAAIEAGAPILELEFTPSAVRGWGRETA
jgi:hypothetical protein